MRRHAGDASVLWPSLSGSGRDPSARLDLGQNSLSLSLDGVAELTGRSLSGCWFLNREFGSQYLSLLHHITSELIASTLDAQVHFRQEVISVGRDSV